MASIGLRRFRYAPMNADGETYGTIGTIGGAIESKMSPNIAEAELYADDVLKERVSEFTKGTLTLGVDDDDDSIFGPLLGESTETYTPTGADAKETIVYKSNVDDVPVFFGFGQVVPKMINNTKKYKVEWFPKVQFKPFSTDKKTKGESLEFTTPSVEGTVFANADGDWRKRATFDSESDAYTFLDSLFVQTA